MRNPENGLILEDVPMLLDSGSDVTLIPQTCARSLGVAVVPNKFYELSGFDGSTSIASVVQIELKLRNRIYRGQFLLIDQNWGVIGRNILNSMSLLLDGPRLIWSEHRIK